ncbi:MAG: hypothetical protein KA761_10580 [Gemmatimonadaceae bacterium]|nr:hypothetical protein [Gemmatimonadaceae bacterium]
MRSLWVVLVVSLVSGCDGAVITEPSGTAEPRTPAVTVEVAVDEAVAPSEPPAGATGPAVVGAPEGTGMAALDALPWEERIGLEQALAASDVRYAPRMDETGPVLETPGSVVATFTTSGAQLSFGGRETTLAVVAVGRDGAMRPTSLVANAEVHGAEVRTARGAGITEWWRSLPSGLEHGVTIAARPAGEGALWVEVAVSGELSARGISDDAVELRDAAGSRVATYSQLVVLDADRARVPARMAMDGERVALVIDDRAARYPLVIDPLVTPQEATLLAPDGAAYDHFGVSVALTSDGSRALVGAYGDDTAGGSNAGSARVFLRTGTTWAQEATLLAPDGASGDYFGYSVALTSDGSRALVGAFQDDTAGGANAGSARVFFRTGTTWAQEAALLAPDGAAGDNFGVSVALTSDGSRALVGAPADDTAGGANAGSARVFLRTGTTWTQEATLLAPDGAADDRFGDSVALTSDGSRALVGASSDDTAGGLNAGSARVFLRTGTTWAQEATLLAPDGARDDQLGGSGVALTSDGSRALVGVRFDSYSPRAAAGTARVFLRTGTTWAQEATLLAPDGASNDQFGNSIALTSDGSRALVGASRDSTASGPFFGGSAHVFLRTGTTWAQEATLPGGGNYDSFGASVALTSDGSRALVGATGGTTDPGNARVFTIALAPNGSTCRGDTACVSGFCTDGVCCNTRCTGGPNDCVQACAARLTGVADGTCAPLSAAGAPMVTCRAATGACDVAETCTSTSTLCPADALATPSTVCRAAAPACDVAETCTGASAACPADAYAAAGTSCRPPSTGSCEATAACTGASATCPANGPALAGTICRAAATACDRAETCDGTTTACAADMPTTAGTTCRASAGVCDTAELCDGASFTCPGDVLLPSGSVCRVSAGLCDLAETCTGSSPVCPGDVLAAPGLVCRPPAPGGCDVAETCTGLLPECPGDLFAPSTTTCGPAVSGVCDAPDHCTGTSGDCMPTFLSGTECRPAAGACDLPESCSGADAACPSDVLVSSGVACGGSGTGSCSSPGTCNGASATCPGATLFPADTVCMPAAAGNPCDLDDVCDGTTDVCRPVFAPSTTACGPAVSGDCDAADHCAGTTAGCVAVFLEGVECRPAAGACDSVERCGSSPDCPADDLVSAGLSCRASTDTSCDPEEMCDGTSIVCPADVTTCMARPDVGPTADVPTPDAGPPPPPPTTGCACGVGSNHSFELPMAISMVLFGLLRRRRLRRDSTTA